MGNVHDPEKVSLLEGYGQDEEYTRFSRAPRGWRGLKTLVVLGVMYGVYAVTSRTIFFAMGPGHHPGHHGEPHHGLSWAHGAALKHQSALGSPEKVEELYLYVLPLFFLLSVNGLSPLRANIAQSRTLLRRSPPLASTRRTPTLPARMRTWTTPRSSSSSSKTSSASVRQTKLPSTTQAPPNRVPRPSTLGIIVVLRHGLTSTFLS